MDDPLSKKKYKNIFNKITTAKSRKNLEHIRICSLSKDFIVVTILKCLTLTKKTGKFCFL